jgi:hypothetical protein
MMWIAALRQALLPEDSGSTTLAALRPMLMLCLLLAPLDLMDVALLGELELLLEAEMEFALGEVGLDFAATLLAPTIGSLMLLFAGQQMHRLSIPDAIPIWCIRGLLPCPPRTSCRIPI